MQFLEQNSEEKAVVEFGDLVVQVIALFLINSGFASINKGQFFLFVNLFFKKSFASFLIIMALTAAAPLF